MGIGSNMINIDCFSIGKFFDVVCLDVYVLVSIADFGLLFRDMADVLSLLKIVGGKCSSVIGS